ncbi:hypothetical protein [Paenibacillus sp. OV219]|uniref:hypothetical protein n=1 Tax=Paenibacillus sp. OV219 TaxID=1884377 RepID=UPI0008B6C341|nr:hypothetical protein [Paenibacillus sp. OV219]SEO00166.1 hypothetical protein SAMN05518847_105215 [Paenibacillus sp. OV219]
MTVNLDIATLVSAVMWPVVICVLLLISRKHLPDLLNVLLKRVKRIDFAGVSLELSETKAFTPTLSVSQLDLINMMEIMQKSSEAIDIRDLLLSEGSADYTVIHLGSGKNWLTSRLFIMSIMFAHQKNMKAFVFLESNNDNRKRYAGWAKPATIRFALAKRYPWFEAAFAEAYCAVVKKHGRLQLVTSNRGELGNGEPFVSVLRDFLNEVQINDIKQIELDARSEWISLTSANRTYEHAEWINGVLLEELLEEDLHVSVIQSTKVKEIKLDNAQFQRILDSPEEFIAITSFNGKFKGLLERNAVLEQAVRQVTHSPE